MFKKGNHVPFFKKEEHSKLVGAHKGSHHHDSYHMPMVPSSEERKNVLEKAK